MKTTKTIKKQQTKVYIQTIIGFAILFLTLGLIIFTLFRNITLSGVDDSIDKQVQSIKRQAKTDNSIQLQIQMNIPGQDFQALKDLKPSETTGNKFPNAPFKTDILIYDKDGKILNEDTLGDRYDNFKNIKLKKKNVGITRTVTINNMTFRSHLIKFNGKTPNPRYAGNYVYIFQNMDTEKDALQNFTKVLITSFVAFWLLSLVLAYVLTRQNMKPVLKSWKQQTDFVNDAAHELRTPLSIIQSKLEILLTKPNDTILDQAESISVSLTEINRLTSLTDELLTLARSDTNNNLMNFEKVIPKDRLNPTIETFSEVAESQGKKLVSNLTVTTPVMADAKKLTQLIVILLDNSLKYTDKGTKIQIQDYQLNNKYYLTVTNDGPSIDDADKKSIFDRFYRIHKDRSRQTGGNGLGLAIAKEIVTNHKGKITVSDNQPTGVIFKIELPINGK
ncbi:signal transduction histidine kinase [Companilactobacillus sp. RD055328]|uniref:sensor histidine kinase n=1 Tax=Companilactobacillus sp. RD055328 TaxID=2916634 RepID=UPI001FC80E38|nr:HAMP domain-containing sensor histidine kinase [Companilactobacillus sp. RD055328]GKQ43185.1 signal transduction histidine kinase [Companilactobacillus sp. RD055328]